jgi:hypothetical protein
MPLTVEDGTGGDAMISLAYFVQYCTDHGYDIAAFDDTDDIEPAIRRASTYITAGWRFQGFKTGGRAQVQAFPRAGVIDEDGWAILPNEIPREVQAAVAEASFYELENPNALNPSILQTERVLSETVGPISTTYADSGSSISASRPVLTIVGDLLGPLLATQSYGGVTARADRG